MRDSLLLALLLSLTLPAAAQADAPNPPPAACAAALAQHFDGGLDPHVAADCDSVAYYYGIGRDKDLLAALSCALIERYNHADKDGSLFTGAGILSQMYANGEGTLRNVDLARKMVCEIKEAAPQETEARLKQLDAIAETPQQPPHFSLCSTASTAPSWGWCTQLQLRIDDGRRYDQMVKLVEGQPQPSIDAFQALEKAEGEFEEVRVSKEVDQSGLASWSWTLEERDRVRNQFVSDLKLFSKPDFSEPVKLDVVMAHLNADYASLRAGSAKLFAGTSLTLAGVDETELAWAKYRDAWIKYETLIHPKISVDDVSTQLARERLTQIYKLRHP